MATKTKKTPAPKTSDTAPAKTAAVNDKLIPLPDEAEIRSFLMRMVRSNPSSPRANLSQVLENIGDIKCSPLFDLCLRMCRKDPDACPDWAVTMVVGSHDIMAAKAWADLGKHAASDTESNSTEEKPEYEKGIVWADQFAKVDIKTVLDACKAAGIWHYPEGTLWVDWDKQDARGNDEVHSDPLRAIKDIEELDILTSVDPAIIARLETEHKQYTGRPMAWTVCHALTCSISPRVFWMPDPAGGAIFFAQTRQRVNNVPGTGLAVAAFPLMRGEWARFADATNFTENTAWKSPDFKQSNSHPVVSVSYLDSQKYLEWVNTGLPEERKIGIPSEPDWLHAATKGDGRTYPWGEQDPAGPIGEELLQWSGYVTKSGTSSVYAHWRGCSPTGIHDMAGNTWEWTSTVHEG